MLQQSWSVAYLVVCLLVLASWLAFGLTPDARAGWVGEHGPIESASAFCYLVAAACLLGWRLGERRFVAASCLILLACAARELDFHTAFTPSSVTKLSYYLDGSASLTGRIGAAAVVVACLAGVGLYIARYLPTLVAALKAGQTHAHSVLVAALLVPTAVILDGLHRTLADLRVPLDLETKKTIGVFEEVLELGIPLAVLLGIVQYRAATRSWEHQGWAGRLP